MGAIKDNEFIKNINYNKNEILNKLIKYDLINLNEDIESINLKLNRSIAMEQNLNLDGYSSYIKQALEYKKEEM